MEHMGISRANSENRDHVAIELEVAKTGYDALVYFMKDKMETISSSCCICRVNEKLLRGNEKAYIPDKVSIGPFHHGKEDLQAMEDHKWRYVYGLLNRGPNLEATLDCCVKALRELEHKARLCYGEEIKLISDEFVQMMLVDGCFIIELFLKYAVKGLRHRNDPLFSTPGTLFDLRCNIMLLENQIPFFILQQLFQIAPIPKQCSLSLTELAFRFFKNLIPGDDQLHRVKFSQEGNHLLDLIRHCFLPTYLRVQVKQETQQRGLNCAIKLRDSGIRLKKATTENLLDIRFVKGVLEIPPVRVHLYTEGLLRNIIAFEHCPIDSTQHVTSYALLMKSLICSNKDVKLLNRKKILTNYDVNDKDVSELFAKLCEDVNVNDFYYDGLCEQVNAHRRTSWPERWKTAKPNEGHNPNSLLRCHWMFVIAILLLVLTSLGALFSILSFALQLS